MWVFICDSFVFCELLISSDVIPCIQFQFEIRRVHNNSTKLKLDILDECNRLELIRHIEDPKLCDEIVKHVQELIKRTYPKQ